MKNPTLKLLTLAIAAVAAVALGLLPNNTKAANSQYFTSAITGGYTYSWDAANWSVSGGTSSGPFASDWTAGDFARFYGGSGLSYTVTVNQAESMSGMYLNAGTATLSINDAGSGTGSLIIAPNTAQVVSNGFSWDTQGFLTGGGIVTISVPITGSGGVEEESGGANLQLFGTNTYTGGTLFTSSGTFLDYNNSKSFGAATSQIGFDATTFALFENMATNTVTIPNPVQFLLGLGAAIGIDCIGTNGVTFTGEWNLNKNVVNIRNNGAGNSNTVTFANVISNTTSTVTFSGANGGLILLNDTNAYTGPTAIGSSGDASFILQLGIQNSLKPSSSIILGGGTLNAGGFNQTNNGSLGLTASSTLYTGGGNMSFSNSAALTWSGTLDLADWSGIGSTYGGTLFRVGTTSAGLTGAQLEDIEFDNNPSTIGQAAIDPNGYVYNAAAAPLPDFSVTTTNSLISQPNSYGNFTTTSFLITNNSGSLATPTTINYTLSGTALGATISGRSFPATFTATPSSGSVLFGVNQLFTNITITAVSDSIARPTTTLTLSLSTSPNYSVSSSSAAINILNTAPDLVFVDGVVVPSMYNVFSNDYCSFTVTRWGDSNATYFANNFDYSGTAVFGVDFTAAYVVAYNNGQQTSPGFQINPGDYTDTVLLQPLINGQFPVDTNNLSYTGNKTIVTSSGGSSATNTIIDAAYPSATYLYCDPLTNSMDYTNWAVTSANDNMQVDPIDEYIDFAYDLYDNPRDPNYQYGTEEPIPFPPNGGTTALRLTVNKSSIQGEGAAAAVNLYLTNAIFSGNYAVRFNMNLICGANPNYSSEGALFGINHGRETGPGSFATNWFAGSSVVSSWAPAPTGTNWESDGVWFWVSVDNGFLFLNGPAAYMEFTGNGGKLPNTGFASPLIAQVAKTQFTDSFKTNIFTTVNGPGLVGNASPDDTSSINPYADSSWADVELKQFDNVVTITIDKTIVNVYTNTTTFTNGCLMLGYEDPYDSVGSGDAAVYYSNLRVVQLTAPLITETMPQGTSYVFDFTSTDGDLTPSSFTVVGATFINGPYTAVAGATITQMGNGAFQATVPISGAIHFYRIQQPL